MSSLSTTNIAAVLGTFRAAIICTIASSYFTANMSSLETTDRQSFRATVEAADNRPFATTIITTLVAAIIATFVCTVNATD